MNPSDIEFFINKLNLSLSLNLNHTNRPVSKSTSNTPCAVLILILISRDPQLLFIQRTKRPNDLHSGQIAFPGGKVDAEDLIQRGLQTTALRETSEEVGLDSDSVHILGSLPNVITGTSFEVTPFVGIFKDNLNREYHFDDLHLKPNINEVERVHWIKFKDLLDSKNYSIKKMNISGKSFSTSIYEVNGIKIWGATAAMIKNLIDRWVQIP